MKIKDLFFRVKSVSDLKLEYNSGDFFIKDKSLTSLKGSPQKITGSFECSDNKLTTLEGGPIYVSGHYDCGDNKLISLKGAPEKVESSFFCDNNNLTSLEYAPKIVGAQFWCNNNKISSFKNVFEYIQEISGSFTCHFNPIEEGLLYILLVKGVRRISSPFKEIDKIINDYLKTNKSGTPKAIFDVQKLIIEAKLKDIPESVYMQ